MELIGIPHRVVVGDRGLVEGKMEYKGRTDTETTMVPLTEISAFLKAKLCGH
jgi:prolyl-tRNA synthetase